MKTTLLFLFFTTLSISQPVITGDLLLCPNGSGTATVTGSTVYDSYEWQYKYWFTSDPFVAIPGANGPSFTYDWDLYDQALLKVVITLDGDTFESNTLQIDSYAWVGLTVGHEMGDNVTFDPNSEGFLLCEGTTFISELFNPYTANIQWFKDGMPISGANSMQYEIASAGTYYVTAAPAFCPDNTSTSLPISVAINTNCDLSTADPVGFEAAVYPNPAQDFLRIVSAANITSASIYSVSGQFLGRQPLVADQIFTGNLASGFYVLELQFDNGIKRIKFVKN